MKLAIALHTDRSTLLAAAVVFEEWGAPEAARTHLSRLALSDKPAPDALAQLQLQCLLQLLQAHALAPTVIVLDGLVHLDAQDTPALGRHLYEALGGRAAVIGVSKAALAHLPAQFQVSREDEAAAVTVTCAGIDIGAAKARVRAMHGKRRVPTLLKLAARVARGSSAP